MPRIAASPRRARQVPHQVPRHPALIRAHPPRDLAGVAKAGSAAIDSTRMASATGLRTPETDAIPSHPATRSSSARSPPSGAGWPDADRVRCCGPPPFGPRSDRIALLVHYASDVVAGLLVGAMVGRAAAAARPDAAGSGATPIHRETHRRRVAGPTDRLVAIASMGDLPTASEG